MGLSFRILLSLCVFVVALTGCTIDLTLSSLGVDSVAGPESISVDGTLTNAGLKITNNPTPNLTLIATSMTPTEMKITNNTNCSGGSWVAYSSAVSSYALTATDGAKDISAQFRDASGKVTSCVNTHVILDTTAPTSPSLSLTADYTDGSSVMFVKSATPTFTLGAVDTWLYQMQLSNSGNCSSGSYETYAASKVWSLTAADGAKTVSAKFQDRFGLESSCVAVNFVLDTTPNADPVISLVEGAAGMGSATATPKVFVKNTSANEVADATHSGFLDYQVRVVRVSDSTEAQTWTSAGVGPFVQLTSLSLADGVTYRMEIRARDNVGNVSGTVSTTWTSSVVPFYVKSIESATPSTEYTSDTFTLSGGAGNVVVSVTNGAKVCISPCADWTAAGTTVTAAMGNTLSLRMTSLASGAETSTITAGSYTTTWKISTAALCPTNYVLVPGENGTYQGEFCVAKYEMKIQGNSDGYQDYSASFIAESRPDGTPWRKLTLTQMVTSCQALGAQYDLITNTQWDTIARNISSVATNWSGAAVGSGQLNQGNRSNSSQEEASANDSEACANLTGFTYPGSAGTCSDTVWHIYRRTHKLTNGNTLWDISGGSWEGVKDAYPDTYAVSNDFVANLVDGTFFKMLIGGQGMTCTTPNAGNNYCGFGKAWLSNARPASGIFRGGSASNGQQAGIFATDFDYDRTSFFDGAHGFRCVAPLTN